MAANLGHHFIYKNFEFEKKLGVWGAMKKPINFKKVKVNAPLGVSETNDNEIDF